MCLSILADHIKVNYCRWDGEEGRVEAVEESAMTGENVSAILDAHLALYETLNKVAPCAKYANGKGESHPLPKFQALVPSLLPEFFIASIIYL